MTQRQEEAVKVTKKIKLTIPIHTTRYIVELTMDLVLIVPSLPPLARIHYEYQKMDHKLRVAAFSGPPVCYFCQICVKLKITHSSLDIYF